eukprot:6490484-Amphidinium_carterae.2
MTFCSAEHIEVKTLPESARRQFVTVTGEGLTISGWKEVTLVVGHMTMQIRFIVANVQPALLGLPDIDENNVTVHMGKQPYLEKNAKFEHLHRHGAHVHAAAIVLPAPGLHIPNEIEIDGAINTKCDPNKPTTIVSPYKSCVGEVDDISQQANISKQLRQPPQPTKQKQE